MSRLSQLKEKLRNLKTTGGRLNIQKWENRLDDITEKIYSPQSYPRIHSIFIYTLTVVGFYSLGKILALILASSPATMEVSSQMPALKINPLQKRPANQRYYGAQLIQQFTTPFAYAHPGKKSKGPA